MINKKSVPAVHSMYWNNISKSIRDGQKSVFEFLDIELIQENADQQSHGVWMNDVIERHAADDIIIFCDIDAFPLTKDAYLDAVRVAQEGEIFGLAQFSNHKEGQDLYAGPMFMAFRKRTWEDLGRSNLKSDKHYDAAEVLSVHAKGQGVDIRLVMPSSCLEPKWALAEHGVFGIGTFYGRCEFFHLFESRQISHETLFAAVVGDVIAGRPLNFRHYLEIIHVTKENPVTPRRRNWMPKPLRRFF